MQNCPSPQGYAAFDVVTVAASLGGPTALALILRDLPSNFPAAILVAQHVGPLGLRLVGMLNRRSHLPVKIPEQGEWIRPGNVYLAPPDRHMLVTEDYRLILDHGSKVKFCRPAAEPLFTSAAAAYRARALGVILTGCNTDGAMGTQTMKWLGGRVLAQDPATAQAGGMPRAAIATGMVDFVLPLDKIGPALVALVMARGVAEYLKVRRPAA